MNNVTKRISKVLKKAPEIIFDDSSKFILISDCHRGDGTSSDDFSKNQNIYFTAINHYYKEGFCYIEIGDGDELWENTSMKDIIQEYSNVFWLLKKYYDDNRLYLIYGNHDMIKKNDQFVKNNLYERYEEVRGKNIPLFKDITINEGLILKHKKTEQKILLIHGHQGELINDGLWKLGRFLVRYIWKPLNGFGISDPASRSNNYKKKQKQARGLIEWVIKEKTMLIAGHTHKPTFPEPSEVPYFNTGSCIHPRCITALEIVKGKIGLVKWSIKTTESGVLYVGRDVLGGFRDISEFAREDIALNN